MNVAWMHQRTRDYARLVEAEDFVGHFETQNVRCSSSLSRRVAGSWIPWRWRHADSGHSRGRGRERTCRELRLMGAGAEFGAINICSSPQRTARNKKLSITACRCALNQFVTRMRRDRNSLSADSPRASPQAPFFRRKARRWWWVIKERRAEE